MSTYAAVMTGKGTGAISTIRVFGDSAETIIKKIFEPTGTKPTKFKTGEILLGTIHDGSKTIDQVTIGCEQDNTFAINCHGNPLIVEMIMQLLQRCGATLLTAEQLLTKILSAQETINTIAIEAKLAQVKAKTLQGTKIIANQIEAGLSKKAQYWLENVDEIPLENIWDEAMQILQKSQYAKLIIYGCTAAIIGPPNSGKSTLLNYLAGRDKAIVTDIKGTTRDWISAQCQTGPLALELIDTAGLDEESLGPEDSVEKAAQQKTAEILKQADVVLLVLDNSQPSEELDAGLVEKIADKRVVTILNKCDLPAKFDTGKLPETMSNAVQISAKFGTGIENLTEKIRHICGVKDFDLQTTVCFTDRQENLLKQLINAESRPQTASILTELLNGQIH